MLLCEEFYGQAWALRSDVLAVLSNYVFNSMHGLDNKLNDTVIAGLNRGRPKKVTGDIGVIPIRGVITHRASVWSELFGDTVVEKISEDLDEMLDNNSVGAIVLDIDSPGGSVLGVMELADKIYNARQKKKIVAVSNANAASAAYWLGSSAEEFNVVPSGSVGSIGVFMIHHDFSQRFKNEGIETTIIKAGEFKAEGNPYEPLTDEAKGNFQAEVLDYYDAFVNSVGRGRSIAASKVKSEYGQGRMVLAKKALKSGMVDRIETFGETLSRLNGGMKKKNGHMMATDVESTTAERVAQDQNNDLEQRKRLIEMF